ncbi:hypothetical protein KKD19_01390 [Patescibacteria group bacterium]|nr:hypothetical protein [Patescibacteria group bacterium]MBU4511886.1 hypothetical protein [Patescibacteria group bacterium]MCG2692854.1 hypothetical protein [Candidatus Parcubacteria bacterium]
MAKSVSLGVNLLKPEAGVKSDEDRMLAVARRVLPTKRDKEIFADIMGSGDEPSQALAWAGLRQRAGLKVS